MSSVGRNRDGDSGSTPWAGVDRVVSVKSMDVEVTGTTDRLGSTAPAGATQVIVAAASTVTRTASERTGFSGIGPPGTAGPTLPRRQANRSRTFSGGRPM